MMFVHQGVTAESNKNKVRRGVRLLVGAHKDQALDLLRLTVTAGRLGSGVRCSGARQTSLGTGKLAPRQGLRSHGSIYQTYALKGDSSLRGGRSDA